MSSKSIRCAHDDRFEVNIGDILTHDGEPRVYVQGRVGSTERFLANPTRADFLDAIRTELNVIVIDKAELPEVVVEGKHLKLPGTAWPAHLAHKHLAGIRADALDGLALADYLEANPPVDPKVEALAAILREVSDLTREAVRTNDGKPSVELARSLLATGRITVQEES